MHPIAIMDGTSCWMMVATTSAAAIAQNVTGTGSHTLPSHQHTLCDQQAQHRNGRASAGSFHRRYGTHEAAVK